MSIAIVTGASGLVGSEACRFLSARGFDVIGIDNDMRAQLFGPDASTGWVRNELLAALPEYRHEVIDIRDQAAVEGVFKKGGRDIALIIHAAAQSSHDWAAGDPVTDFTINANGTLTLLEAMRNHTQDAVFIQCSTNKVYGDKSNELKLREQEFRWEPVEGQAYAEDGFDESLSIDQSKHSLFGVSKVSADLMVQEYGRYFGLKTACFRAGCITGAGHSGARLHGFLSYLMGCAVKDQPYTVFGYKGKQVRDNIHAHDLVSAFWHFYQAPTVGAVYNIGGGRHANCSMLEAIAGCEKLTGRPFDWSYSHENRSGDHIWWISDIGAFRRDYPEWEFRYGLEDMMAEMHDALADRHRAASD